LGTVLGTILRPKGDEVTGGWRGLHNKEFHNLYSSLSIIKMKKSRKMRWAGHVAQMEEKSHALQLLMGKSEGRRQLQRPRCRWVNNIRMDLELESESKEDLWESVDDVWK
jgi:hypothetical protein